MCIAAVIRMSLKQFMGSIRLIKLTYKTFIVIDKILFCVIDNKMSIKYKQRQLNLLFSYANELTESGYLHGRHVCLNYNKVICTH